MIFACDKNQAAYDMYTSMGLRVIPLYARSKIPVGKNWNQEWDKNKVRKVFQENPEYNLGLLLGNIIDVEADTDDANSRLENMIGNYPHPMYQSARSVHHLFLNPDPSLTATKLQGIEFRGHKHQSVLPPSIHSDGRIYSWMKSTVFPVPKLPLSLLEFYLDNRKEDGKKVEISRKKKIKPGHIRTICKSCKKKKFVHKKRLLLEVRAFKEHGLTWQCHECRQIDVRDECRFIRKTIHL